MKPKPLNRRSFICNTAKLTAGVIGFPYIVRSSALGKAGTVAPGNRLVTAQIGCGGMGGANLKSFLHRPDIQIVAVCDVDERHAAEKKRMVDEHYGNQDCRIYYDFRELLETESLDVVSHALPDHWHAYVTIACARKGIDMYGEKPISRTIGEGRAMCDAIDRYGIIWQTGSWQRSVEQFHRAAELIRNGRIGKVRYVEVGLPNGEGPETPPPHLLNKPDYMHYDLWLGPAPWRPYQSFQHVSEDKATGNVHYHWRHIFDYSGGKLTDWGGHHIDIAHWGLGFDRTGPVAVEGKGKFPESGIYDVAYEYDFLCTYANGLQMRVANRNLLSHGQGVCWYGDAGWLFVSRRELQASDPRILRDKIGSREIRLYHSRDHIDNFIECVKSRRETVTPAETAHRSISVAFLGEIAMLTGRKLTWNPEKETFIGDEQANRYLSRSYRSPWRL